MEPQDQQNQQADTQPELHYVSETPTPIAETPAVTPQPAPTLLLSVPPLRQMLVGGSFLAVSILTGMALVTAYLPPFDISAPEVQVAAAHSTQPDAFAGIELTGKGVYVVDGTNDRVLYSKNPDAQLPLASITKVMLALAVAEVLPMDGTVIISREAVEKGGGGLTYGEEWKVRELLDYLLIASSNTAAEALAEAAEEGIRAKYPEAPAERIVIWRMNKFAKDLGMKSTYFLNPSGLDESITQAGALGSAKDVATLFSYALRTNRELFAGTSREFATLGPINGVKRDVHNTNAALMNIPHIYMGKTGLTDLAGGNLAIAYDAGENHPVVVVVLGSSQDGRFSDVTKLVETTQVALTPPASTE
jgi:D-alanyl-D-alanine carboxypeptidase (penicillin-binding protein 5/6)